MHMPRSFHIRDLILYLIHLHLHVIPGETYIHNWESNLKEKRCLPLEAPVMSTFWPLSEKRLSDGMIGVGSRLGAVGIAIDV